MNIIEELSKKYNGNYSEEQPKSVNSPIGKYLYQPKTGLIEFDGSKIGVNIDSVGGAIPVAEPFRITLYLDKNYLTDLTIFPKSTWNRITDLVFIKNKENLPKQIRKQFTFVGERNLIMQLGSNAEFTNGLMNEKVYIRTDSKKPTRIVLTPAHGIEDIEQFEKFISLLKIIEKAIKTGGNIG
ncbi:hypothetical protein SAMN06296241_0451 [Salinimicrobium sediminis]|uniref:Uncharacterized protein n=1 Tax=Salinimicrobium sediminis TaxID=1343891 RepID=A0A285X0M9_9FLAO|nr:hypothetical protein [Salinimicrobium sediminis]SOC78930.1 hypothetical protein SAMN06296241_0450 [Salinimicrobium sediminis]SOC78931.1 hypothetical protein SAMN06296241_0451 [Salinimicrobium sediminis]